MHCRLLLFCVSVCFFFSARIEHLSAFDSPFVIHSGRKVFLMQRKNQSSDHHGRRRARRAAFRCSSFCLAIWSPPRHTVIDQTILESSHVEEIRSGKGNSWPPSFFSFHQSTHLFRYQSIRLPLDLRVSSSTFFLLFGGKRISSSSTERDWLWKNNKKINEK